MSGEGWRETKNACLISATYRMFDDDPQLEPPACFLEPKHVAKIAETEALSVAAPAAIQPPEESSCDDEVNSAELREHGKNQPNNWRPKRLVRTVVASVKCSRDVGRQVAREAKRRRFLEAPARVFPGDGLPWNGTIWKEQFADGAILCMPLRGEKSMSRRL